MTEPDGVDFSAYVLDAACHGDLVVQPRMGMADPATMSAGLVSVADACEWTAGTITLDSYTRVGDHDAARDAVRNGRPLNGFPLVAAGAEVTAQVAAAVSGRIPVQVRHGSSRPDRIFATMADAGLFASEGGPVSYCLPYGRTPLAESIACWREASARLAARSDRAHLETFGGCLLGQLCPPSLLVAMSVLEAAFFAQCGLRAVSLSYAQQTNPVQDVEALAALRHLATAVLPEDVTWHVVVYTFMGVYPGTAEGAGRLLADSAAVAVRGGAERLVVKTAVEQHRIPTIEENVAALTIARQAARLATVDSHVPWHTDVDYSSVLGEAEAIVRAVLALSDDIGAALLRAFRLGLLDVPFCLHRDNHGRATTTIDPAGRLSWADTGRLPLPGRPARSGAPVTAARLLALLRYTADRYDSRHLPGDASWGDCLDGTDERRVAAVGGPDQHLVRPAARPGKPELPAG